VARVLSEPDLRLFVALSYPIVTPDVRKCFDYVFVMRDTVPGNRRILYQYFGGNLPSLDQFCCVLDQTTRDYECLVVDLAAAREQNDPKNTYFFYKASPCTMTRA
jgi:hypothetical protein